MTLRFAPFGHEYSGHIILFILFASQKFLKDSETLIFQFLFKTWYIISKFKIIYRFVRIVMISDFRSAPFGRRTQSDIILFKLFCGAKNYWKILKHFFCLWKFLIRIFQELVYTRYASGHPLGCPLFPGISRNFREFSFKKIFFSKFVRFFRKEKSLTWGILVVNQNLRKIRDLLYSSRNSQVLN